MPRLSRSIVPGYFYHLTHRGNNRQQLFFSSSDSRGYLYCLEDAAQKYKMDIMAYCVMKNHVHIVAVAREALSFARAINSAHLRYARHFHKIQGTVGHVWQGRYYSCLLEESHFLAAIRYVERNPVRASFVCKPWDWVWSSAREHLSGQRGIITLMDYKQYMDVISWKSYIDQAEEEKYLTDIRLQTHSGLAMGSDEFKRRMEHLHNIKLFKNPVGRPAKQAEKIRDVFN